MKGQEDRTYEGMREKGKAIRKAARTASGYGKRRTEWGKHALAAYTWTRTNRGPLKAWLHHIGKTDDPSCTCGHPSQDGEHVVLQCPNTADLRNRLLPAGAETWEALDDPHWVVTRAGEPGREQEKEEGTEIFFQELYWRMKRAGVEVQPGQPEDHGER